MSKNRVPTWLALIILGAGGFVVSIFGLFAYMSLTAPSLHPDAPSVPSVMRSAPSPQWADAVKQGQAIARASLAEQNLPGLSVAIGVGGDMVWAEGFGYADLDQHTTVTPATRFRIGAVSNALTAAAVGLLLEKDKLRLDAEIQSYVPEFQKKQWPVTLHHLMAQVGGVTTDGGDEAALANAISDEGLPNRRCERTIDGFEMDNFATRDLLFEPGTQYRPSTYSWIVVSAAIESAAQQDFFPFMRSRLFEPLGMRDTLPDDASQPIADRATFYFPKFAGDTRYGPQSAREGDHSCYAGGGAFLSTPSDLVRFGMAITGNTFLQPATIKILQAEQQLASGEQTGYG
ncbi:MAG: beta-lactamase family protein, partial [Acidobacteriota bacterium]|nr:beta-lactamase family protein [Acidobacteriota bacterium]